MEYLINLAILFCIYGTLALSLNMVVGMAGLLSLAQAAFYGIGAYAAAIGMTELGLGFFSTLLLGMLANGILAFVVGKILSRFQGDYYAIVSAGLSVIVFSVLLNWKDLTNGPLGIFGIPKPEIGSFRLVSNFSYLVLCLAAVALSCGIYVLFDRSSFGRTLKALREDEQLTRLQGYNTKHFKSIVFVVSAMMSGIAGAMFPAQRRDFSFHDYHCRRFVFGQRKHCRCADIDFLAGSFAFHRAALRDGGSAAADNLRSAVGADDDFETSGTVRKVQDVKRYGLCY